MGKKMLTVKFFRVSSEQGKMEKQRAMQCGRDLDGMARVYVEQQETHDSHPSLYLLGVSRGDSFPFSL